MRKFITLLFVVGSLYAIDCGCEKALPSSLTNVVPNHMFTVRLLGILSCADDGRVSKKLVDEVLKKLDDPAYFAYGKDYDCKCEWDFGDAVFMSDAFSDYMEQLIAECE